MLEAHAVQLGGPVIDWALAVDRQPDYRREPRRAPSSLKIRKNAQNFKLRAPEKLNKIIRYNAFFLVSIHGSVPGNFLIVILELRGSPALKI